MGQEFHVLCCYSCSTFQTHIVKKIKKWECKMCGEKQSVKKVYGQGTAKDCRLHTQKLNRLRLNKEEMALELCHMENDWGIPEYSDIGNKNSENSGSFPDNIIPRDHHCKIDGEIDSIEKIYLEKSIMFSPTTDCDIYKDKIFSSDDLCSIQQKTQINNTGFHRTLEKSFKTKVETHVSNLSSNKWDKYLQETEPSSINSYRQDNKEKCFSDLSEYRYTPYKHKRNKARNVGLHEFQPNLLKNQTMNNESNISENETCSSILPDIKYNLNTNVLSLTSSTKIISDSSKDQSSVNDLIPNDLLTVTNSENKLVNKCESIFEQFTGNDDSDFEIDL